MLSVASLTEEATSYMDLGGTRKSSLSLLIVGKCGLDVYIISLAGLYL